MTIFRNFKNQSERFMYYDYICSTVDLDGDLEKISRTLKFGVDVPYTFKMQQKKSPPIAP